MESKSKGYLLWIEAGYEIFLAEGYEGLKIERIARKLRRNKSGYYHYFIDHTDYLRHLLIYHRRKINSFVDDLDSISAFDPDYSVVLKKHEASVIFNFQLAKYSDNVLFKETLKGINEQVARKLLPAWADYIGLEHNPGLALQMFMIYADLFSIRCYPGTIHQDSLIREASAFKHLVAQLRSLPMETQERSA